ncbi:MAG: glycosyltransferase family 1 protein [Candidatus Saganbacteria bacterium]|nr:glycosyltransferase family 1 protein [Candidatus Saganbacteria bacterium]
MRIAFDCRWFKTSNLDGIGGYTLNLVKALLQIDRENEYLLLFDREDRLRYFISQVTEEGDKTFPNLKTKLIFPADAVGRNFFFFPLLLKREHVDVFHSPCFMIQPMGKTYRLVLTIHDLLAYRFPNYFQLACPKLRLFLFLEKMQEALLNRAEALVVHTEELKKELLTKFKRLKPENIKVISPGIEEPFKQEKVPQEKLNVYLEKYKLKQGYILFRGKQAPHLNLTTLIKAFQLLPQNLRKDHPLVIAGIRVGSYHHELKKLVRQLNLDKNVIFMGFISRRDLPYIYQGASLFVYPALYDHYSMPLLEALASGTPAIASNLPQFISLLGESLVFSPLDVQNLSVLMQKTLENPSTPGSSLSWQQTALKVLGVYRNGLTHK